MTMTSLTADQLTRLTRMIEQISEFAADHRRDDHRADADPDWTPCDCTDAISYAIDALADDIHECGDDHDSGDNPYPLNEREFDTFAELIALMTANRNPRAAN
jgi:hypothetical protein